MPPERTGVGVHGQRSLPEYAGDAVPDLVHVRVPRGGGYRTMQRTTQAQAKQREMVSGRMTTVRQAQGNIIRDIYDEPGHIEHDTPWKSATRGKVDSHAVVGVG